MDQAHTSPRSGTLTATLLPFALLVFLGYAAVGLPLAALPLQVHGVMGLGTTWVGVVVGMAPAATLVTRQFAGRLADRRGPRFGVLAGLVTAAASGLFYLVAVRLPGPAGLAALLAGRVVLGVGDSLLVTAATAWTVARVGVGHAGRAMSWIGIAMYGALAVGAPAGLWLSGWAGFGVIGAVVVIVPLLAVPVALLLADAAVVVTRQASVWSVIGRIWPPGLGLVLASGGFGTVAAFLSLRFAARGWGGAGVALSAFGAVYIVSRLLFGGLPDRIGGVRVAILSLCVEACGLALIAAAWRPGAAIAGTALTGLGYSMVFPALGVEAVRRVGPESRGVALGLFLACFDLGLGGAGPVMGVIAAGRGLPAAFLAAAAFCLGSVAVVWTTRTRAAAAPR